MTAENNSLNSAQRRKPSATIDGTTGLPLPMVNPLQRTPLKTLDNVKRELARVYRAVKLGHLPSEEGTKRAYILNTLGKIIEVADLERRMDRLEQGQAKLIPGSLTHPAAD